MKATIFDIQRGSYVDGPGIRTTVFFKGCNLRCAWCHNPESHTSAPQLLIHRDKCTGCGKCKTVCPTPESCTLCGKCTFFCPADARAVCGREYSVEEVLQEVLKDKAFYRNSGGGVTFSGGECMLQADFLAEVLKSCKENGICTAVDTAGHIPFERFRQVLPYTDLFLYDIKCADPRRHLQFTGVDNRLILSNLEKLFAAGADIHIRIPVIPGFNDTPEEMLEIKKLLADMGTPKATELLPYHAMGEHKYRDLGQEPQRFSAPDKADMERLQAVFRP